MVDLFLGFIFIDSISNIHFLFVLVEVNIYIEFEYFLERFLKKSGVLFIYLVARIIYEKYQLI
jgi:hypothetical protein